MAAQVLLAVSPMASRVASKKNSTPREKKRRLSASSPMPIFLLSSNMAQDGGAATSPHSDSSGRCIVTPA